MKAYFVLKFKLKLLENFSASYTVIPIRSNTVLRHLKITGIFDVTPCRLADIYWLIVLMMEAVVLTRLKTSTRRNRATSQKAAILIFSALRIWNLAVSDSCFSLSCHRMKKTWAMTHRTQLLYSSPTKYLFIQLITCNISENIFFIVCFSRQIT